MESSSVTSKSQVTIPKEARQRFGSRQGTQIEFELVNDPIEMRVKSTPIEVSGSGFGMLKSDLTSVPADLDPARVIKK